MCIWINDLTLFEALMGGAFGRLNWQHSGEFDQNFSKILNAPEFAGGGGGGLTGTLWSLLLLETCIAKPVQKVACFLFVNISTKTRQILFLQNTLLFDSRKQHFIKR